jgi:hypothetical protein
MADSRVSADQPGRRGNHGEVRGRGRVTKTKYD